jgi:hypothetical protein
MLKILNYLNPSKIKSISSKLFPFVSGIKQIPIKVRREQPAKKK